MAEGMEVDSTPVVRDKKRFEVKKVYYSFLSAKFHPFCHSLQWNAVALWAWGRL